MKGSGYLYGFVHNTTTSQMTKGMIILGLFLSLVGLPMAVSMTGCGSSGGGGDVGGSVEEPAGPMSLEGLEQFWLESYDTEPQEEVEEPVLTTNREPVAKVESCLRLRRELLAKAKPDECFDGIGYPYPPGPPCNEGGIPKVNQAYVWGLTKSGDDLWFGTAPNVHCLVIGSYLGIEFPHQTGSWVCEFGMSQFESPFPPELGDWRPPRIFVSNTWENEETEKTLDILLHGTEDALRLSGTSGIRSAGTLGDVVILGGPGGDMTTEGISFGINLFAFETTEGRFLGSAHLPEYDNIRKWLVVDEVLYTAVGNDVDNLDGTGGSVLRWTGGLTDPFEFEVVGLLDSAGAELAEHEGRLFVSTWPSAELAGSEALAGLYMSPKIPFGGLDSSHAKGWTKVWEADDYEPDPVTARTYGGGALASHDGYLFWGTMHVPFLSTVAHFLAYPPKDEKDVLRAVLGTYRAITIFRGRNFGTEDEEIDLVYGMRRLPVYDPIKGEWWIKRNKMRSRPIWGLSGFGNFFNTYTWTMAVYDDQLFVGTMDWSYLFYEVLRTLLESEIGYVPGRKLRLPKRFFGADLWRFRCANSPAVPESLAGVGNYTSYGIRTMVSDDALYLGMANPMNLLTDPTDGLPDGGWELIKLSPTRRVKIDIKPGSYPNPINLKSKGKVPVAVLTSRCFWAGMVDPETVLFAGAKPVRWTMEDVDYDGDKDLLFHFKTQELADLNKSSTIATLTGETFEGREFEGTDTVKMVPKGK